MSLKTSSIPGFRNLTMSERRALVSELLELDADGLNAAFAGCERDAETADAMVENALGILALPVGVALHMQVNGQAYLVPMAVEEPSVIAATSHAAKRAQAGGGFFAEADPSLMIAQVEVHDVSDAKQAREAVENAAQSLLNTANEALPGLIARGGGARSIAFRDLGSGMIAVHIEIDCLDAMGANMLNTAAEALGPRVAELSGGTLGLRILSNYCDRRLTRAWTRIPVGALGDERVDGLAAARGIENASLFAERDVYRAVTHNKGIMNGVDAVVVATGNDFRAVEAAAHAFAARSGRYSPLSTWRVSDDESVLEGRIELPLALGTVGGALRAHRGARAALAISGAKSSRELSMLAAAAGLASNLSALRALATEGIQRGHMSLHHRAKDM